MISECNIEKVRYIKQWTTNLFSFRTTRNESFKFIPGQFARLGVINSLGKEIFRPYSIVSADYDEELEFYSIIVPDGEFTQILKGINIGDEILVNNKNYGLLTTDRFENGKHLWLLSTGTGLAPFISILYEFNIWSQYEKIILVHCTRTHDELVYQDTINNFYVNDLYSELVKDKLKYLKIVTRENFGADLYGRITTLIENKQLENYLGIDINSNDSRVMICGNPDMVNETRKILTNRGLTISKRGNPGNIAVENYW